MYNILSGDSAKYEISDSGHAVLSEISGTYHHFKVPAEVILEDGKKYKIVGLSTYLNKIDADIISFDETSDIEKISKSHLELCKSIYLPPRIKRIIGSLKLIHLQKIFYDKNNKFISILDNETIINNHPLEIVHQKHYKSRLSIRETVRFISCDSGKNITSVTMPQSVEIIGRYSFRDCKNLQYVKFKGKSNLKNIEECAFNKTAIKYIAIPPNVEIIGIHAFYGCKQLKSVIFSEGSKLKLISNSAFGYTAIESLEIPPSVRNINYGAFENNYYLKTVIFRCDSTGKPSVVSKIDGNSFGNCGRLKLVEFPKYSDDLILIGDKAFAKSAIESIEIPPSVQRIGNNAFSHVDCLRSVTFARNSKLRFIGSSAFSYTAIESIEIPSSVEEIGYRVFECNDNLKSVTFKSNSKLELIGECSFSRTAIESIEIPSSVQRIGNNAFSHVDCLRSVTFARNSKLRFIGSSAFSYTAIESIEIPSSVEEIGYRVFECNDNLKSVTFKSNSKLELIGECAFSRTAIESIEIPSSVIKIDYFAFEHCKNLKTIILLGDSKLQFISFDSFSNTALESIVVPIGIKRILAGTTNENRVNIIFDKNNQFWSLSENQSIMMNHHPLEIIHQQSIRHQSCIRETVRYIGNNAFSNNMVIRSVAIPASVEKIGRCSFKGCNNLRFVSFNSKSQLKLIGGYAFNETAIESIEIPCNVNEIGKYAFNQCNNLRSVTFLSNENLLTIKNNAFRCTAIESIRIPSSVERIDMYAFSQCNNLEYIIFPRDSKFTFISDECQRDEDEDVLGHQSAPHSLLSIPYESGIIVSVVFTNCNNLKSFAYGDEIFPADNLSYLY